MLLVTAIVVLLPALFIPAFVSGYYVEEKPLLVREGMRVLDTNGSILPVGTPLVGTNGSILLSRNMVPYHRVNAAPFALMGLSACLFIWWLIRASRHLYASFIQKHTSQTGGEQNSGE
jgi:hypothetical protein